MDIHYDVKSILEIGRDLSEPKELTGKEQFVVLPEGKTIANIKRADAIAKELITVFSAESAVEYINRYKSDKTVAFVNSADSMVVYIIDYHKLGEADYTDHKVVLRPQETDQFKTWSHKEGDNFSQIALAEFLEDNEDDLCNEGDAAKQLREAVIAFTANKDAKFNSKVNLANGDVQLMFHEETKGNGSMILPEVFKINVPIYEGGPIFKITIRLRFRLHNGELTFFYKLANMKASKRKAFSDMVAVSEEKTEIPHYLGER